MNDAGRRRADLLLVERGLVDSRSRAQALIEAGLVVSDGIPVSRPGQRLPYDASLEVLGRDHPWVSRGGIKLDHALEAFALLARDLVCVDLGASTGGFTEVLLSRGAARVYAVDVGHGQLARKLRDDPRVVNLERTNARHLDRTLVPQPIDLLVCDASFISLDKLLPAPMRLVRPGGTLVALIKPQFEVGRGGLGKGGVVRDAARRDAACRDVAGWLAGCPGWSVLGLVESPITGPGGNREYLIAARRQARADLKG